MREVIWLKSAIDDLTRLRSFLGKHNSNAATRAALEIRKNIEKLIAFPLIGKPVTELEEYRDLKISFGASGYVMRYRIFQEKIYIVYIKHCLEKTFKEE
jgi:plasmid stabilization system protein ParE